MGHTLFWAKFYRERLLEWESQISPGKVGAWIIVMRLSRIQGFLVVAIGYSTLGLLEIIQSYTVSLVQYTDCNFHIISSAIYRVACIGEYF